MSNKETQRTATKAEGTDASSDDARSVMSDTSTLADGKQSSSSSSSKGQDSTSTSGDDAQLHSAAGFAKQAAKQGWAAPTATRPTFG
ncbi:hypothetical protein BV20DRAFT_1047973 [Pilatotrama ljubarskyi]|nr:hypothetical protein BV20DRAFT_1047973 [Pilatotrama ljubarskyi]